MNENMITDLRSGAVYTAAASSAASSTWLGSVTCNCGFAAIARRIASSAFAFRAQALRATLGKCPPDARDTHAWGRERRKRAGRNPGDKRGENIRGDPHLPVVHVPEEHGVSPSVGVSRAIQHKAKATVDNLSPANAAAIVQRHPSEATA